jgi:hypothetical protein
MHRFLFSILIALSGWLLTVSVVATEPIKTHTNEGLRYPLDVTRRITSTFCELRPDRFHAGLDFSINGSLGANCYAIDDGYISRIKTTFNGYGRVIYLTLNSGDIAVYAHLAGFEGRIEEKLREEQLKQGRYQVELWFKPGEIPYKNGDVIGYAGGTGAGAPHLHFEMRTPRNDPYNPVLAGLYYDDKVAPYVRRVAMRPLDGDSEVEGRMESIIRSVEQNVATPVKFYGRVGISAQAHDFQQGGWARLGVRELALFVDDSLRHRTVLDTFPYALNRHSRLEFDYELGRNGDRKFRRLYVTPGNKLDMYEEGLPGGELDSRELGPGVHQVRIEVVDHRGNRNEMHWSIEALHEPFMPLASAADSIPEFDRESRHVLELPVDYHLTGTTAVITIPVIPDSIRVAGVYATSSAYESQKKLVQRYNESWVTRAALSMDHSGPTAFAILIEDSSGTVYEVNREMTVLPLPAGRDVVYSIPGTGYRINFEGYGQPWDMVAAMTISDPEPDSEAPILNMFPRDYPFLTTFELFLASGAEPFDDQAVMVYREHENQPWQFLSNFRERNGFQLSGKVFSFETFSVAKDTVAPELFAATPRDGVAFSSRKPRLRVSLRDEFSGLDMEHCHLTLNGEIVIWVYDPDAATIEYTPWESLDRGTHTWQVVAVDNAGNRTELNRSFVID